MESRVDILERNHVYDRSGRHQFSQFIGWRWHDDRESFHVQWWRMDRNVQVQPCLVRPGCVAVFHDGQVLRRVVAESYRESWTTYDPEIRDRKCWPVAERRGLPSLMEK